MDSYLEIAKKVLLEARLPLGARQMLKLAYQLQIVPPDLYGRTQHKTLQARLSTDILHRRRGSEFYRTAPGRFFLRAMQADRDIPARYRREHTAPLRAAQLGRFDVLTISRRATHRVAEPTSGRLRMADISNLPCRYVRMIESRCDPDTLAFRIVVLLLSEGRMLLRQRRPASEGEIPSHSAVGVEGFVKRDDRSLFSNDDVGLFDAALRTISEWLRLSPRVLARLDPLGTYADAPVLYEQSGTPASDDLVIIVSFDCSRAPEVLEATRDSGNYDWQTLPLRVNDVNRFDRWSKRIVTDASLQTAIAY
jgi:hypothetical protein